MANKLVAMPVYVCRADLPTLKMIPVRRQSVRPRPPHASHHHRSLRFHSFVVSVSSLPKNQVSRLSKHNSKNVFISNKFHASTIAQLQRPMDKHDKSISPERDFAIASFCDHGEHPITTSSKYAVRTGIQRQDDPESK